MKIKASFDDGCAQDLQLSEMMRGFGIATIFYFPADNQYPEGRDNLTSTGRQQIAKYHEIGSHTVTHPLLTRIGITNAKVEIAESRQRLQKEFKQQINSFCYPRGYANAQLQKIVADAGYTNARGVSVGYLDTPENPFYEQTTVHVGCDRKEYGGQSWFDYALNMLTQSAPDSTYHFWGHGYEIAAYKNGFVLLNKLCQALVENRGL